MKSTKIEAPGILMIHRNLLLIFVYSVYIMTDGGDFVLMVDNNFIAILPFHPPPKKK